METTACSIPSSLTSRDVAARILRFLWLSTPLSVNFCFSSGEKLNLILPCWFTVRHGAALCAITVHVLQHIIESAVLFYCKYVTYVSPLCPSPPPRLICPSLEGSPCMSLVLLKVSTC